MLGLLFLMRRRMVEPAGRNGAERPGMRVIEEAGSIEGRGRQALELEPVDIECRTTLPPRLQARRGICQPCRASPLIQDHRFPAQRFG